MHKTATTSIQNILINSSESLEELAYTAIVNKPELNAKSDKNFDPNWIINKIDKAKKENKKAIIVSAEIISTFNMRQMSEFIDIFNGHEVIVIACFRHWVSFLPSRWAQNCSRRDSQSLASYIRNLELNEKTHIDARFDLVISRIIDANPSRIRLVSYDNAIIKNSLLPTMFSALDLPNSFINNVNKESTKHLNSKRSLETTELVRLFNGIYSLRKEFAQNELFDSINKATMVKQFYDNSKAVVNFLNQRNSLKRSLLKLINDKNNKAVFSQNELKISQWEEATNEAARGFVYNPLRSQLFDKVLDKEIVCSQLESEEISAKLQQEMMELFD